MSGFELIHRDVLWTCFSLSRQPHFAHNNKFVLLWVDRNTPDPAQETQGKGYSKPIIEALSAVCVRTPNYGTRSVSFGSRQGSDLYISRAYSVLKMLQRSGVVK